MPSRQFEPSRAVEVITPRYGSGYRIGGGLVLTAAHLLDDVSSDCIVRAKQNFGEMAAHVVWKAQNLDIALIELPGEIERIETIVLGRLPTTVAGEKLAFQMYAYPRWGRTQRDVGKTAAGGRQIEGVIYLADSSPDGLLVLEPQRLPPAVTTAQSEWEGASGAVIICDGLVIAVQSQHQNPKRPASLEASPLWKVYDDEQWRQLLEKHGINLNPEVASLQESLLRSPLPPAAQPVIVGTPNNIPLSGSPDFTGREDDLKWLQATIQEPTLQAIIVALAGMGGVGKTELAIQYARRHINDYLGGVCWIFAREFEIAPQIVSFAVSRLALRIPEGLELPEQLSFCWQHWREGNVLLVLDDVESYTQIQACLPPDQRFKVLLTTRRIMQIPVRSRSLEVLTQTAAIELLSSEYLLGQIRVQEEQRVAEILCDWLGYLPLGIELVGRYLHQEPDLPLANMLFNLQHRALSEESLMRDPEDENWSLTAQRGVAAAFELSWVKLKEDPKRLGRLLSLFALAPIPWKLVESAEQYRCDLFPQNGVFNPDNLRKARRELIGLHLLKQIETGNYLLHSLIRKFFQQKLEEVDNATN